MPALEREHHLAEAEEGQTVIWLWLAIAIAAVPILGAAAILIALVVWAGEAIAASEEGSR